MFSRVYVTLFTFDIQIIWDWYSIFINLNICCYKFQSVMLSSNSLTEQWAQKPYNYFNNIKWYVVCNLFEYLLKYISYLCLLHCRPRPNLSLQVFKKKVWPWPTCRPIRTANNTNSCILSSTNAVECITIRMPACIKCYFGTQSLSWLVKQHPLFGF